MNRNCEHCLKYLYDEETGRPTLGRDGKPEERAMYDVNGTSICPPPCRTEKGCPKGTPEHPKSLNPINRQCYQHYRECRAVGEFPKDPVVKRNAAIIREAEDDFKRYQQNKRHHELIQLLTIGAR